MTVEELPGSRPHDLEERSLFRESDLPLRFQRVNNRSRQRKHERRIPTEETVWARNRGK